jgi:hypothetical protein
MRTTRVHICITRYGDYVIYFDDKFYIRKGGCNLDNLIRALRSCHYVYMGDHPASFGRVHKYISLDYLMDDDIK